MISKLQYWSEHVRELERQGVTLASYARENDLSKSQFVYWRQKIQNMNSDVTPEFRSRTYATCAMHLNGCDVALGADVSGETIRGEQVALCSSYPHRSLVA